MLPIKNLVKGLFTFVETGEFPFKPGVLRDGDANPIMDISSLLPSDRGELRAVTERLLNLASDGHIEALEAQINMQGKLQYALFSYVAGTAIMVPCVERTEQLPYAILAMARIADTGVGDSLAHRISKCQWCGKYFIRKTKKASRYHTTNCRVRASNQERLNSGWFKRYYLTKKENRKSEVNRI